MLRVERPTVVTSGTTARIQCRLVSRGGSETLWYEVDRDHACHLLTSRLDAFAVAAMLIAMERGQPEVLVDGPMSERLLHGLTRVAMPVLSLVSPGLRPTAIRAEQVSSDGIGGGSAVGTGFSNGIDSAATLADYRDGSTPGYTLTHLLSCNVGSHDRFEAGRRLFRRRLELVRRAQVDIGLPLVVVDSNLADLLSTPYEATLVARLATVPLVLQGLFARFLHSSSHKLSDCSFRQTGDHTYTDPTSVPAFSTESLECVSVGCEYSRVDKTRKVLGLPWTRRFLNVCVHPAPEGLNCSTCYKCLRTLATLDLLGHLAEFSEVFDLDAYGRRRLQYLLWLPGRLSDPYIAEIWDLARRNPARLPPLVAAMHRAWPVLGVSYRAARWLTRRAGHARRRRRQTR